MESKLHGEDPGICFAAYFYCLRSDDPDERILEGLCDPRPRVARPLQKACRNSMRRLSVHGLLDCLHRPLDPAYRRPLLRILAQQSTKQAILEWLRPTPDLRLDRSDMHELKFLLDRIARKEYLPPSADEVALLEQRVSTLPKHLPYDLIDGLKFIRRMWKTT